MNHKPKIAIVRGKFLNRYEMQFFEPLVEKYDITAFGSLTPYHDQFAFPVVKLPSPMDLPDIPYKMSILNRLFIDAHYLLGVEEKLKGFDLVHTAETYFRFTQQCLDAKRKGYVKKVIATVLENIPFNNEGIRGRQAYKKRAREELDHIIALTQKTKTCLIEEGTDPKKITVISHYIDTKRFYPANRKKGPHNHITILFSGRLETYKGVFDVLDVMSLLRRDPALSRYAFDLIVVGEGSEFHAMVDHERELDIDDIVIHKTVPYDEMPLVYNQADIFIAPSKPRLDRSGRVTWEEQYSTVLLEAQASGLAIVTTRSGGIPENIADAGLVVSPGDIDALRKAVNRLILDESLRRHYSAKARERALGIHDISIGARKLDRLYQQLLSKPTIA